MHLGVIKPGEGAPHRNCAVRCLSGAVPPMVFVSAAPFVSTKSGLRDSWRSSMKTAVRLHQTCALAS
jgi:hypothetical protein